MCGHQNNILADEKRLNKPLLFFMQKKKKVNQHTIAINLGKEIEMKNLDKKNVCILI